jgi:hypothetical protein
MPWRTAGPDRPIAVMEAIPRYAFDVAIHPRPGDVRPAGRHQDAWGDWQVLAVSPGLAGHSFSVEFEEAVERLAALERMFIELDGALVWRGECAGRAWQIDGNAWDRGGRLARIDVRGCCPAPQFDRLLTACGWPADKMIVELLRAGLFLDEETFRRHAAARATGEAESTLRHD